MLIQDQKRLARRTTLARRSRVSIAARAQAGADAATLVLSLPEIDAAGTVMGFNSFGAEIPTDPLVSLLLRSGKRVLMPVVEGERLLAGEITSLEEMAPGYRGILEPALPKGIPPVADVIIVPGVAFDAAGRRLGYGGGFYDVFLSAATGFRVGLCYDCQIVDEVPSEPHDQTVAVVVTESRVIRAGG
jgi:5-formyltetrahydrofolate cyclo-ligase